MGSVACTAGSQRACQTSSGRKCMGPYSLYEIWRHFSNRDRLRWARSIRRSAPRLAVQPAGGRLQVVIWTTSRACRGQSSRRPPRQSSGCRGPFPRQLSAMAVPTWAASFSAACQESTGALMVLGHRRSDMAAHRHWPHARRGFRRQGCRWLARSGGNAPGPE